MSELEQQVASLEDALQESSFEKESLAERLSAMEQQVAAVSAECEKAKQQLLSVNSQTVESLQRELEATKSQLSQDVRIKEAERASAAELNRIQGENGESASGSHTARCAGVAS
jgi:chromosome segregation ATPase